MTTPGFQMTLEEVRQATSGEVEGRGEPIVFTSISTDTRTLQPGALFVALRGERFDGASFVGEARRRGARGVLLARGTDISDRDHADEVTGETAVLRVPDTLRALGDLARHWRERHDPMLIALTGSNGKTTAKEMIAAVLQGQGGVLKSEGNYNNLVGVPLTLFRLRSTHRYAVLEMGMNSPGEIERLAEIARPCIALITNVHPAHLEGVPTLQAIARAKGALYRALGSNGVMVINADDDLLLEQAVGLPARRITFGRSPEADVRLKEMEVSGTEGTGFTLEIEGRTFKGSVPHLGEHNAMNATAAVAVGHTLGIEMEAILRRLPNAPCPAGRLRLLSGEGLHLLDDSYNANPRSMDAALLTLEGLAAGKGRAVAVLGDMLELGKDSPRLHRELGRQTARRVQILGTFGPLSRETAAGAREAGMPEEMVYQTEEIDRLNHWLNGKLEPGDWVLVKGSRGMQLERVVEALLKGQRD